MTPRDAQVHSPYAVSLALVISRERDAQPFFREDVNRLSWKVDKFDSKTLILTRPFGGLEDGPVDDSFTFKERGRAAAWCRALDQWYLWEPL